MSDIAFHVSAAGFQFQICPRWSHPKENLIFAFCFPLAYCHATLDGLFVGALSLKLVIHSSFTNDSSSSTFWFWTRQLRHPCFEHQRRCLVQTPCGRTNIEQRAVLRSLACDVAHFGFSSLKVSLVLGPFTLLNCVRDNDLCFVFVTTCLLVRLLLLSKT